ncbi:MAG: Glycine/serine hydroxymethyltransferase [Amphiamblys sp. WSBS2006]|nr:MAG: Glycine/serine hydroxymethyltransferase [Amphiamblys sp. WSBS2006]
MQKRKAFTALFCAACVGAKWLGADLQEDDQAMLALIEGEKIRQQKTINLIASENYARRSSMEACGSVLTNKYSEGTVGNRYYGGTEFIDHVEKLCQDRALSLFGLDPEKWGVNVQAYSGSPANFAVYTALLQPGEKLMGFDLSSGGHLTHGFKMSASSKYFASAPYYVDSEGFIDYARMERDYAKEQPKLLIAGYSAYTRDIEYARMKKLADTNGAYLMADVSHIGPMIASGIFRSPFESCDIVTTTTQKGFRGPRGALIFYRNKVTKNGKEISLGDKINKAVFPALQGGPHNQDIAGIAVALHMAQKEEFKNYAKNTVENAKTLGSRLKKHGFELSTGGTENHLLLFDMRSLNVNGDMIEKMADRFGITLNKNTISGDKNALTPSGIRIGTYALTTRRMGRKEMEEIAEILSEIVKLCQKVCRKNEKMTKKDFQERTEKERIMDDPASKILRDRVSALATVFPAPL